MSQRYYSVDQVAELLDLHVRTVRSYVRDGKLRATRIGKQYRVTREDLEAFLGRPVSPPAPAGSHAEVSAIVQVDAIDPEATMRLTNTVIAATVGRPRDGGRLRVETVYDEERASLKIIVVGGLTGTAELLKVIDTLIGEPD
ncbi:MAG: MerR family transcriptional regulator [Nonomuraea muscovyensis]|nr:MerR family transcriptional regulator [Nonomuraea muscovyensis]